MLTRVNKSFVTVLMSRSPVSGVTEDCCVSVSQFYCELVCFKIFMKSTKWHKVIAQAARFLKVSGELLFCHLIKRKPDTEAKLGVVVIFCS